MQLQSKKSWEVMLEKRAFFGSTPNNCVCSTEKTLYSHFWCPSPRAQPNTALTVGAVLGAGLCSGARPSSLALTDWRIAKIFLAKFWKRYQVLYWPFAFHPTTIQVEWLTWLTYISPKTKTGAPVFYIADFWPLFCDRIQILTGF